jgi:threonine dehydratase
MSEKSKVVTIEDVRAAVERIASYIHRTPVLTCESIDRLVGARLFFKCENLQKSGAFKFRGAVNAIAQLSPAELNRGVVTHSSGNHAGALARAARIFGVKAFIVMPSDSSEIKKAAVKSYGGEITECEPTLEARQEIADQVQETTGAILIPPFNHPHIIAGQGTAALELMEQVPHLDAIVAPIGGGGLMSGTCISARALKPQMLVLGGEPAGADDAFESKRAGKFIPQTTPNTISDGLRTSLGDLTWPYIRDQVDEIITVSDEETIAAMKLFWERTKSIIEPSSAVPLAAIMKKYSGGGAPENIGIIISGGNVDLLNLPW